MDPHRRSLTTNPSRTPRRARVALSRSVTRAHPLWKRTVTLRHFQGRPGLGQFGGPFFGGAWLPQPGPSPPPSSVRRATIGGGKSAWTSSDISSASTKQQNSCGVEKVAHPSSASHAEVTNIGSPTKDNPSKRVCLPSKKSTDSGEYTSGIPDPELISAASSGQSGSVKKSSPSVGPSICLLLTWTIIECVAPAESITSISTETSPRPSTPTALPTGTPKASSNSKLS